MGFCTGDTRGWQCFLPSGRPDQSCCLLLWFSICKLREKAESVGAEHWSTSLERFPFQSPLLLGSAGKSEELDVTSDTGRQWQKLSVGKG